MTALVGARGCGQRGDDAGVVNGQAPLLPGDTKDVEITEWALMNDTATSVGLLFNPGGRREVVAMRFTDECWLELPVQERGDSIALTWLPALDTKYDFDFARAVQEHPPTDPPGGFMTLLRTDDSTLRVVQVDTSIAGPINRTSTGAIPWIPDSFHLIERRNSGAH
jgi:hypothetical protein